MQRRSCCDGQKLYLSSCCAKSKSEGGLTGFVCFEGSLRAIGILFEGMSACTKQLQLICLDSGRLKGILLRAISHLVRRVWQVKGSGKLYLLRVQRLFRGGILIWQTAACPIYARPVERSPYCNLLKLLTFAAKSSQLSDLGSYDQKLTRFSSIECRYLLPPGLFCNLG